MRTISPAKAAMSVGAVIGLYHLVWVILVAVGLAKPFLDFVLRLHFIQFDYEMAPFDVRNRRGAIGADLFDRRGLWAGVCTRLELARWPSGQ